MPALLQADAMREDSSHIRGWRLSAAGIAADPRLKFSDDIVVVPTEELLILPVDLPLPTPARRIAALPFAVEDRLAEPLAEVHLALGAALEPHRHIAAAVRHDRMQAWMAALAAAGLDAARLVPDALMLPRPRSGWAVALADGRAVVRSEDGTGFAVAAPNLPAAWIAAGRPACVALDEPLPAGIETEHDPSLTWPTAPSLDLRQGAYAVRRRSFPPTGRRILVVAAAGILAHGAIAAADTIALGRIAAKPCRGAGRRYRIRRARRLADGPGSQHGAGQTAAAAHPGFGRRRQCFAAGRAL
jgi:general secretion pathway protein L